MNSVPFQGHTSSDHDYRPNDMSYTYGPDRYIHKSYVYFGGDQRVVKSQHTSESLDQVPAWLVADWMIQKSRGQPLTAVQENYTKQQAKNPGLCWLHAMLS